jgi:acyl-CoA thioesterase FadM
MKEHDLEHTLGSCRFVIEQRLRYIDVDTERHVNNVAVHALHAEACMRFQMHLFGDDCWQSAAKILHPVHVDTQFIKIMRYPDPLRCGIRLLDVSRSACNIEIGIFQNGDCVGIEERKLVFRNASSTTSMPEGMYARLLRYGVEQGDMPDQAAASLIEPRMPSSADAYPVTVPLSPRYGDLDSDSYTSALAVARYAEQGRAAVLLPALERAGIHLDRGEFSAPLTVRTRLDFLSRRPVQGDVKLSVAVPRLGNSSFDLRVAIFDDAGCMAVADSVLVIVGRETGRPTRVPDKLRTYLERELSLKN